MQKFRTHGYKVVMRDRNNIYRSRNWGTNVCIGVGHLFGSEGGFVRSEASLPACDVSSAVARGRPFFECAQSCICILEPLFGRNNFSMRGAATGLQFLE